METRPHWMQREERAQGRRMAQLKRSTRESVPVSRSTAGQLPVLNRAHMVDDLRRITITTGVLTSLLIVLTLALR